jgi:hypothetical protein
MYIYIRYIYIRYITHRVGNTRCNIGKVTNYCHKPLFIAAVFNPCVETLNTITIIKMTHRTYVTHYGSQQHLYPLRTCHCVLLEILIFAQVIKHFDAMHITAFHWSLFEPYESSPQPLTCLHFRHFTHTVKYRSSA